MNENTRKTNAHFIIHTVAVSAAGFAFAFSWIPGVGPTLGDTAVLTTLTIAMTMMLGNLFDQDITATSAWSVGATAVGFALGTSLLKAVLGIFPFVGPAANAAITLALHEAIGWGLYTIFENGYDPTKMTSDELKASFEKGREVAKRYENKSKEMDQIKERMTDYDKKSVANLEKKIASKNTSQEDRMDCIEQMKALYKKYGYNID